MADKENALVPANGRKFKMPRFGKRVNHLKEMLQNLNQEEDIEVINHADGSTSKLIHKIADSINEGTIAVENDQVDLTGKKCYSFQITNPLNFRLHSRGTCKAEEEGTARENY